MGEQALIFYLDDVGGHAAEMGLDDLDALIALQNQLTQVIEATGIGEVDGHEMAVDGSEGSLYAYGPDAKAMLAAALPIICRSPLAEGGRAYLRYGAVDDAAARAETFSLSDLCAARNT